MERPPFSPRAWRCFYSTSLQMTARTVFSTCVEVFPERKRRTNRRRRFLHVRGGVSPEYVKRLLQEKFSPRAWRCFTLKIKETANYIVFSTCVEVFLFKNVLEGIRGCFLHVRGGVSDMGSLQHRPTRFSPRAWRCFRNKKQRKPKQQVFSTCVEVFPENRIRRHSRRRFLHVRGGVSPGRAERPGHRRFSPRAWRCF